MWSVARRKLTMLDVAAALSGLRVPPGNRLEALDGRRGGTPDTALRLARALGTTPEFWLRLQERWDLWHAAHGPTAPKIAAVEPFPLDSAGALVATA